MSAIEEFVWLSADEKTRSKAAALGYILHAPEVSLGHQLYRRPLLGSQPMNDEALEQLCKDCAAYEMADGYPMKWTREQLVFAVNALVLRLRLQGDAMRASIHEVERLNAEAKEWMVKYYNLRDSAAAAAINSGQLTLCLFKGCYATAENGGYCGIHQRTQSAEHQEA